MKSHPFKKAIDSIHRSITISRIDSSICTGLFLLLLFFNSSAEDALILKNFMNESSVSSFLSIYEDTTGVLPCEFFVDSDSLCNFKRKSQTVPNLGFSHSAFWLKFDMIDSSSYPREWVIDVAIPSLHLVDFFITCDDSILVQTHSGFEVGKEFKNTPFRNPSIQFKSIPNKSTTIYLRIKSETPVITPVFIREKNRYIEYDRNREFMFGLYFGALLIMASYHFYLFISTSDRNYLWLVLFIICFGLGQMSSVYGFLADWGFSKPGQFLRWLHIINYLAVFFALLLSCGMIRSRQFTPRCNKVLRFLQITTIVFTPLSPCMNFMLSERILLLFNIMPLPFLIYSALVAYRKKHRPSLYYLLAASSFIAGIAIYNFMYGFALFPYNTITYFIPNITFIITLSLYSIGLADMINIFKKDREQAREQTLLNISEKLILQKEKAAVVYELEQSRKLESIGRVLSGVAHDVNNLLNPILGYSLLIRNECKTNVFISKSINNLINATHQLKDLTSSLLDISKKRTHIITSVDLNNAVRQIGSLLKHSSPKGITVLIKLSENHLLITADTGMIQSAILNVGLNAIDAMPKGGTVTIETDYSELILSSPVRLKFGVPAGLYATVSIQDTGIGMDQKIIDNIFEPFFTTKKDGKGAGLGLFSVYNCIKQHNGCIDLCSKPGEGCRIILYFPRTEVTLQKMSYETGDATKTENRHNNA